MSLRLKQETCSCDCCGEEGYRQCSICRKQFCEKHCKSYHRHHEGLYFCHLSLNVCVDCEKKLGQLDPGDLLARIEINRIRYA